MNFLGEAKAYDFEDIKAWATRSFIAIKLSNRICSKTNEDHSEV